MIYVRLGKTELIVSKPAMGCLPVQRCGEDDAVPTAVGTRMDTKVSTLVNPVSFIS